MTRDGLQLDWLPDILMLHAVSFIHTADIHLDSPLLSLSLRDPDLGLLISDATRQALVVIVDLCLEEQLMAGDLYDGDQTSMKTGPVSGNADAEAGISVYTIRGNPDALSKIIQATGAAVFGEDFWHQG